METLASLRLLSLGNEDTLFLSIAAAGLLHYLARTYLRDSKDEQDRLQELFSIPQQSSQSAVAAAAANQPVSRDIYDVLEDAAAVVLWASQGGTAETMASRYASELSAIFATPIMTAEMIDYDAEHLSKVVAEKLVVFIISTFGEGSPPDNGADFLDALRALRGNGHEMTNLHYVMFGLGNSNYTHFNKYALDVDDALRGMGAHRVGALGLGDDCKGGTDEDFLAWKTDIEPEISTALRIKAVKRGYVPRLRISPWEAGIHATVDRPVYQGEPISTPATASADASNIHILPLLRARCLVALTDNTAKSQSLSETRQCIHLDFSLAGLPTGSYQTGDYLCVWPMNPDREIEELLRALKVWDSRETIVKISPVNTAMRAKMSVPTPATIQSIFRHYLDICGPVSREMVWDLAQFADDAETKLRLQSLARDRKTFSQNVTFRKLTLATVLKEVIMPQSQLNIPLSFLLERLNKLQPRSYSISSSALVEPDALSITASVECDPPLADSAGTLLYRFRSLASNYLLQLQQEYEHNLDSPDELPPSRLFSTAGTSNQLQGGKIYAHIRRSTFKLPRSPSTPIIMIGSGTGIAPFRAFVLERMRLKQQGAVVGKMILLAGHRSPHEDYYYSDLWQEAREVLGEGFEIRTAFSRAEGQTRQYVQDALVHMADAVMDTLKADGDGVLYICGSSLMANGVRKCIADIRSSRLSAVAAGEPMGEWLTKLVEERRLQEDSWG